MEQRIMEKILTVVIPSYNVEKYIDKCLKSFVNINCMRDIEVLVVNDGSTDKTAEIAKKFADEYPSSFVLLNKENGGHGSTINYAIPRARGKYFKVVDGDDWVDTQKLPEFVSMLKKVDSDMISNDFNLIEDETWKLRERRKAVKNSYYYDKEWGFAEAVTEPEITIHSLTVKTEILKNNPIKLDEHCFYEDQEYILYPVPYCTTITFSSIPLYQYRVGRAGQSIDVNVMIRRQKQHMRVIESLLAYSDIHADNLPTFKKKYFNKLIAEVIDDEYRIFLAKGNDKQNVSEMMALDKRLKKNYPAIYASCSRKSVWLIRKTNYKIFPVGVWIFKLLNR